jgi:hypothetical protein
MLLDQERLISYIADSVCHHMMETADEWPLPSGWIKAFDAARSCHYYCNASLGLTQWSHPLTSADQQGEAKSAPCEPLQARPAKQDEGVDEDEAEDLLTGEGLYYLDPKDVLQGPFTMAQVTAWRPFLPMDLRTWIFDAEDFQSKEALKGEGPGRKRQRDDKEEGEKDSTADTPAERIRETVRQLIEVTSPIEFAELMGDAALLADYREAKSEGNVPESLTAPSAAQWERAMLYGLNSQSQGSSAAAHQQGWRDEAAALAEAQEAGQNDDTVKASSLSYAEAVLSALPEDDEAVQLSRGRNLKQVILHGLTQASTKGASVPEGPPQIEVDYNAAQRNPLSGKLTAVGSTGPNARSHLYAELSRYANPDEIERQMAEAAALRGRQLPPEVWKQLKARREQVKKKMKLAELQRY